MDKRQIALLVHAALLVGALFLLVPMLTGWDPRAGFLFAMTFQWLFFCLPVIGWHALPGNGGQLFSEKLPWRDWWIIPLLLTQVTLAAGISFVPNNDTLTSGGMWLAVLIASIHGPLAEMAWRGGFLEAFHNRPTLGFWLGQGLYALSLVPVALCVLVAFPGGWPIFIGSAVILGLFWGWVVWRTGSVFYVSMAHGLTAIFAFWILFDHNGFVTPV
jgi:hypothetical protein